MNRTIGGRTFRVLFPDVVRPLTEEERRGLRVSIATHGVKTPIIADEAFGVIDGANRLAIAEELGLDFVPIHVEAGLTDEQKRALAEELNWERRQFSPTEQQARRQARIIRVVEARQEGQSTRAIAQQEGVSQPQIVADLREAGDKGLSPLPTNGTIEGKDGKTYPASRPSRDVEAERQKRSESRQARLEESAALPVPEEVASLWSVITGDCIEELGRLAEQPRLIFADPPYNIGYDYGDGEADDLLPYADYVAWANRWVRACFDALTDDGSLWLLVSDEYAAEYRLAIRAAGFAFRNWIKWYETFGVNCTGKFNRTSRHLLYAVKSEASFVFNREAVSRPSDRQTKYNDPRANPDGKVLDDVWMDIPRLAGTHGERLDGFPTQLPVELLERIVRCASDPGDLVADPFNGSGTTGAAALRHERRYVGIEKRDRFALPARLRLRAVVGELFSPKKES